MAHLFSKTIVSEAIRNIEISDIEKKISIFQGWLDMYNSWSLQKKSEKEFEWVYNESFFGEILGYTSLLNGEYTREKEPRNVSNGQKPDIGLGFYSSESHTTQAIVELKDAGTSLDRPQQRAGNLTPVQQAFKYKSLYNSKWVIVSNFFEIRLYTDTYQDFESFTLRELVNKKNDYENFRIFYVLLQAGRLIKKDWESETEKLLAKVRIEEEKISKVFYKEYKTLRLELMRDIWANNPHMRNADVIEKSQRIIDRIVFICFCEDRGLLLQNKLKENILRAKEIDLSPWETLKIFFRSVDKWSEKLGIPDGYNGGLFKADESIDKLKISDTIVEKFVELGRYDFSEDGGQLSVEILGHIFEQSISDIEEIRTDIENHGKVEGEKETEKKVSKRKKDGIFYTPAYIVDYIVENSLGKYLSEHEEALKEKYALKADITEKNYRKRELEAYTEYQNILHNVKVLDPACGSGAFLVRVFDFLLAENKRVANILIEDNQANIFQSEEYFRGILKNNIYGVDLNEESVEITKLSLWLKSAVKGKKLVTLDDNIKCGNSLIDDPLVAGDKAFDWNQEFSDIMVSGWFDVIVGNPPYGARLNESEFSFLSKQYDSAEYRIDTYALFFEEAIHVLKNSWMIWFISPFTFLTWHYFQKIRQFLNDNIQFEKIVLLWGSVFMWAAVDTGIFILSKNQRWKKFLWSDLRDLDNKQLFFQSPSFHQSEAPMGSNEILLIDESIKSIFSKIDALDILKNFVGFYHGIQTRWDNTCLSWTKKTDKDLMILKGEDIGRYVINDAERYITPSRETIKSGWNLSKYLVPEKLFMRTTGDRFITTYDDQQRLWINSLNLILPSNQDYSIKYLLTILNSRLIRFWYDFKIGESGKTFAEVKIVYIEKVPIPSVSFSKQQPLIDRADTMLALHHELHDKSDAFLKNISAKYKIEKFTRKLEKWWELDFANFARELKVKLSLEEQEELMSYFNKRKSEISSIVARIEVTDKEIDEMVFDLYGLTEEERRVVLESNGK